MKYFILTAFIFVSLRAEAESLRMWISDASMDALFESILPEVKEKLGIEIVFPGATSKIKSNQYYKDVLSGKVVASIQAANIEDLQQLMREDGLSADEIDDIKYRVVGRDMLRIVVGPSSISEKVSHDQLAKVLSGKIRNWKDLGGADQAITVFYSKSKLTALQLIERKIIGGSLSKDAVALESYQDVVAKVKATPGALGYASEKIAITSGAALLPTPDIGRPLTLLFKSKPTPALSRVLTYISQRPK